MNNFRETQAKPNELQIIDWERAVELAAGRDELAKELLNHFLNALPASLSQIETAHQNGNIISLIEAIHRLHGACCYCGLPRLKQAIFELEHLLVQDHEANYHPYLETMMAEINNLRQALER